jgi:hypothetical protein
VSTAYATAPDVLRDRLGHAPLGDRLGREPEGKERGDES